MTLQWALFALRNLRKPCYLDWDPGWGNVKLILRMYCIHVSLTRGPWTLSITWELVKRISSPNGFPIYITFAIWISKLNSNCGIFSSTFSSEFLFWCKLFIHFILPHPLHLSAKNFNWCFLCPNYYVKPCSGQFVDARQLTLLATLPFFPILKSRVLRLFYPFLLTNLQYYLKGWEISI